MTYMPVDIGDVASLAQTRDVQNFYFLRHGRTAHNLQAICQGSRDIPLDPIGRRQALDAGHVISRLPLERVVTSPLSRASLTAQLATQNLRLPILEEPLLMERGFGDFEGSRAPQHLWQSDLPSVEPRADFARRVAQALVVHCRVPGVMLVAHGGVLRAIAALFECALQPQQLENARPLIVEHAASGWVIKDISMPRATQESA